MNLQNIFSKISKQLDEIDQDRELILKIARQIVRDCSVAIKSIHREEFIAYEEKINEIKDNHKKLLEIVKKILNSLGDIPKLPNKNM